MNCVENCTSDYHLSPRGRGNRYSTCHVISTTNFITKCGPHRYSQSRPLENWSQPIRSSHVIGPSVWSSSRCEPVHSAQTGRFNLRYAPSRRVEIGSRTVTRSNRRTLPRRRFGLNLRRVNSGSRFISPTGSEKSTKSGEESGFSFSARFFYLGDPFGGEFPAPYSPISVSLRSHPSHARNLRRRRFNHRRIRFADRSGPFGKQPSISLLVVPATLRVDETRLLRLRQAENRSFGLQVEVEREPLRIRVRTRIQIRIQVRRVSVTFSRIFSLVKSVLVEPVKLSVFGEPKRFRREIRRYLRLIRLLRPVISVGESFTCDFPIGAAGTGCN